MDENSRFVLANLLYDLISISKYFYMMTGFTIGILMTNGQSIFYRGAWALACMFIWFPVFIANIVIKIMN